MATLLLDIVRKHIIEDDYSPSESFESLLQGGYEWESIYAEIAKAYYDFWEGGKAITTHFIRKIETYDYFDKLCAAWFYCGINKDKILKEKSKTRKLYTEYFNNHPGDIAAEKRMLQYMEEHLRSPIPAAQLARSVASLKEEILFLMERQEMQMANRLMDNFQKNISFF